MAFEEFTHLYSISKTLRFELKPVGKTLENIKKRNILTKDMHRADSYAKIKKIIDEYHKALIERVLSADEVISTEDLRKYCDAYVSHDKKKLQKCAKEIRKKIVAKFNDDDAFGRVFKKELIESGGKKDSENKADIVKFINKASTSQLHDSSKAEALKLVEEFKGFTTYFSGYNDNRKNMYTAEEKSTGIAYRLINQNLPKFIDNICLFERVLEVPEFKGYIAEVTSNFGDLLNGISVENLFSLDYYKNLLTQSQITLYNTIIGGRTIKGEKEKSKGLNEYINKYNQDHKDCKLPKLQMLFKQILSDRVSASWIPEEFSCDQEVLNSIRECYDGLGEYVINNTDLSLKNILSRMNDYNTDGIYVCNNKELQALSKSIFKDWRIIKSAISERLKTEKPRGRRESDVRFETRISNEFDKQNAFSVKYIDECVKSLLGNDSKTIESYFASFGETTISKEGNASKVNVFVRIEKAYNEAKELLTIPYPESKKLNQDDESIAKIKELLDAVKGLQYFIKPLLADNVSNKDERFYGDLNMLLETLDIFTPLYNKVRNYVTKKTYINEKFKLYFENNAKLLTGWTDSKTESSNNGTQYGGYLFRKKNIIGEYDYYLGISANSKLFRKKEENNDSQGYERLNYYQIKPDLIFGNFYTGDYKKECEELKLKCNAIRPQENSYEFENEDTIPSYLRRMKSFDFGFYSKIIGTIQYETLKNNLINTLRHITKIDLEEELKNVENLELIKIYDIVKEIASRKLFSYFSVSEKEIKEAVESNTKPLFLFKISNKDLSFAETYSDGKRKLENRGLDNLHTMYFKALMDSNNGTFDIGSGTIFYREKGIVYSEKKNKEGHHYAELKEKFSYPIISKKRYTEDKFLFHLSITANYSCKNGEDVNTRVNEYLRDNDNTHVIGIDRGERNLLYLVLIDSKGRVKEQYSLNEIINEHKGKQYSTDYHDLLDKREKERLEARQSWKTIDSIKDLKDGYLSQVIHKITQLMVKYNAIVVLEDLNFGFMRGRQKFEKAVYQKFEKMLIDKLNFYVDKKKDPNEPGGLLNALQLTNKFESFQKLGKQNGFLFYIPAWNTSKIDPVTGFTNLFDVSYKNIDSSKAFFKKFQSICYNSEKSWFEFSFDYNDFTQKAEGTRTSWTICTQGDRIRTFRNVDKNSQWDNEEICLTAKFKELLEEYKIDYNNDLKKQICVQTDAKFYERLLGLLKLTLQMRNSKTNPVVDYLISPVADENGVFFDSRESGEDMPKDADANGAYNIARKGLMVLQKIKEAEDPANVKFNITNKEWLRFAQDKTYLND